MKKLLLVVGIKSVLFGACSQSNTPPPVDYGVLKSARNDSLYTLVGKKHDDVMPKDSDIESCIMRLRSREWAAPQKDSALSLLGRLNEAHDAMMDWMHEFKGVELFEEDYTKLSEPDIFSYLQSEEKRIEIVAEKMLLSLKDGEAFLQSKN